MGKPFLNVILTGAGRRLVCCQHMLQGSSCYPSWLQQMNPQQHGRSHTRGRCERCEHTPDSMSCSYRCGGMVSGEQGVSQFGVCVSSEDALRVRGTLLCDRLNMLSTRTPDLAVYCRCCVQANAHAKSRWSNESTGLTSFSLTTGFKRRQRQLQTRPSPACTVKVADSAERACEQVT